MSDKFTQTEDENSLRAQIEKIQWIKTGECWERETPVPTWDSRGEHFKEMFGALPVTRIYFGALTAENEDFLIGKENLEVLSSSVEWFGYRGHIYIDKALKLLVFVERYPLNFSISFFPDERLKDQILDFFEYMFENTVFKNERQYSFGMITECSMAGLRIKKMKCNPAPIDDYSLFYGEKFPYDEIMGFGDSKDALLLLHGEPGTGKTNFIKNMIANVKRDVVYIPPNMMSLLSSPKFIPFLMDNKGKLFLIEDAEEVLTSDRNSATNNLLGATDGFLKDALDLKIICTFNTDIKNIDQALLRKGRLYLEYKFGPLSVADANRLAAHVGIEHVFSEPSTLADIFNVAHETGDSLKTKQSGFIGFNTGV